MKDSEQIEVKIPVPWSSEPVGVVFRGWRCVLIAILMTAAAAIVMLR